MPCETPSVRIRPQPVIYIYGLLTKSEVKDGWVSAKFLFFCVFMVRDEIEVHKHAKQKKNTANIQPS